MRLQNSEKEEGNIHFISDDERTESFDKVMVHQTVEDIENLLRKGRPEEISGYLQNFFDQVVQHKISQSETDFILMLIVSTVYQVLYSVAGEEVVQQNATEVPDVQHENVRQYRRFQAVLCRYLHYGTPDDRRPAKEKQCDALQPCDPHHQREICRSGSVPCLGQHRDFRQPELLKCTFEKGYR